MAFRSVAEGKRRLSLSPIALGIWWLSSRQRPVKSDSFGSLFLKFGLFRSDGLTSLASLMATNIGLFFGTDRPAGGWLGLALVLNLKDLRIDSLVCQVASINLEKKEKDRFFRNSLYSPAI